jgi:hypothetical protein
MLLVCNPSDIDAQIAILQRFKRRRMDILMKLPADLSVKVLSLLDIPTIMSVRLVSLLRGAGASLRRCILGIEIVQHVKSYTGAVEDALLAAGRRRNERRIGHGRRR